MTNDTEKCVTVLTRCGPYSRAQASDLVPTLASEEVAALVGLHGRLAVLEAATEDGVPGGEQKPEPWKLQQELAEIGERFRQLLNVIADREARAKATKAIEQKAAKVAKGEEKPARK